MINKIQKTIIDNKGLVITGLFLLVSYFHPQVFIMVVILLIVKNLSFPGEATKKVESQEVNNRVDFDPNLKSEGIRKRMENLKQYRT